MSSYLVAERVLITVRGSVRVVICTSVAVLNRSSLVVVVMKLGACTSVTVVVTIDGGGVEIDVVVNVTKKSASYRLQGKEGFWVGIMFQMAGQESKAPRVSATSTLRLENSLVVCQYFYRPKEA